MAYVIKCKLKIMYNMWSGHFGDPNRGLSVSQDNNREIDL